MDTRENWTRHSWNNESILKIKCLNDKTFCATQWQRFWPKTKTVISYRVGKYICIWRDYVCERNAPDSKVHWAKMEPTWVLSAPEGPHVGPMNFAIRGICEDEITCLFAHITDTSVYVYKQPLGGGKPEIHHTVAKCNPDLPLRIMSWTTPLRIYFSYNLRSQWAGNNDHVPFASHVIEGGCWLVQWKPSWHT